MTRFFFIFFYFISLLIPVISKFSSLEAMRIIEPIEVNFKVEDGDFKKVAVKEVIFANSQVKLEETRSSLLRTRTKYILDPGIYVLEWTTEEYKISEGKTLTRHKKVIELEVEDRLINLWIKGDKLTFF